MDRLATAFEDLHLTTLDVDFDDSDAFKSIAIERAHRDVETQSFAMRIGGLAQASAQMQDGSVLSDGHDELRGACLVGQRNLVDTRAEPQHASCKMRIIRIGLESLNLIDEFRECEGKYAIIGTNIDRRTSAADEFIERPQLVLTPRCLISDPSPKIERRRYEPRHELLFQGQRHTVLLQSPFHRYG